MNNLDGIKAKGSVHMRLWDKNTGKTVQEFTKDNLIVTLGKELLVGLIGGIDTSVAIAYMAVGTDNTAPDATDIALGTEVYREVIGTATKVTTSTTDDTCQFVVTLDEGDSGANAALTEAGLFGSDSTHVISASADTGMLLSRITFSTITKTSSLSLTLTWKIQFT